MLLTFPLQGMMIFASFSFPATLLERSILNLEHDIAQTTMLDSPALNKMVLNYRATSSHNPLSLILNLRIRLQVYIRTQ